MIRGTVTTASETASSSRPWWATRCLGSSVYMRMWTPLPFNLVRAAPVSCLSVAYCEGERLALLKAAADRQVGGEGPLVVGACLSRHFRLSAEGQDGSEVAATAQRAWVERLAGA